MLILMELNSTSEDVKRVKTEVEPYGCKAHKIEGTQNIALGITGNTTNLKEDNLRNLKGVTDVIRVSRKYKLVSRMMKPDDTKIEIGNDAIGGNEITIIAGPCSVESRDQIFQIAETLANLGIKFMRAGAYKPRSSPYAFQGMKEEGLLLLDEVKREFGLKIVTELLNPAHIDSVKEVADIIQIGARNMQNFSLLEEVGRTGMPVLLKRGLSATIEDLLLSAEYIVSQNNYNVILCERGIRTFESFTRNTLDLNAVPVLKSETHLPVFVDPSHGIGIWDKVPAMAMASIAAGADGLMVEVHPFPQAALSDGYQSLTPKNFHAMLEKLKTLAEIMERRIN